MELENFFNNQSVSAFLGAFAAFFLVVINDWRRERRKVACIKAEFDVCLGHSDAKIETVRRMLMLLTDHNQVSPAPVMPFNTTIIRQLTAESIDKLTIPQRSSIDAICYRMEAIDGLLQGIYQLSLQLSGAMGQADRIIAAERLAIDLKDALINLKILRVMLENYASKKFRAVVSSNYIRADFED
jgi:hypothetical protein